MGTWKYTVYSIELEWKYRTRKHASYWKFIHTFLPQLQTWSCSFLIECNWEQCLASCCCLCCGMLQHSFGTLPCMAKMLIVLISIVWHSFSEKKDLMQHWSQRSSNVMNRRKYHWNLGWKLEESWKKQTT